LQPAGAYTTGKFLRLLYDGTNASANAVTFNQTAPGLFPTIVADFDFRITDVANNPADGFSFLLVPTTLYGTNGAGLNTSSQAAEEPNYGGVFGIGFDVYPHASHNDVSAHWDGTERINITIPTSTIDLAPSLLVSGPNMLAIQGLNFSAGSSNFLIQPQLLARELVLKEPATYLYPAIVPAHGPIRHGWPGHDVRQFYRLAASHQYLCFGFGLWRFQPRQ
jgi:hypothetical protein